MLWLLLSILSIALFHPILAQQDVTTCAATRPCYQGCCSKDGNCGFGLQFCGDGCQGNCDAKAECGQYAPDGKHDCPINVCCRSVIGPMCTQKAIADLGNYVAASTVIAVQRRPSAEAVAKQIAKGAAADNLSEHPKTPFIFGFDGSKLSGGVAINWLICVMTLAGAQDVAKILMR